LSRPSFEAFCATNVTIAQMVEDIPFVQSVLYKSPYSGCSKFSGFGVKAVAPPAPGPPGPPGPAGPPGPPGPAGTSFVWRGPWDNTTTYSSNDTVSRSGSTYISLEDANINNDPLSDPVYWNLMAQAGAPGTGTAAIQVWGETPAGAIDGANLDYTTANAYSAGLLAVYLNGLRLRPAADYTETGSQSFQFINAPLAGDSLSVDYIQP
jgi:hypothetical protein